MEFEKLEGGKALATDHRDLKERVALKNLGHTSRKVTLEKIGDL